MSFGRLRADQQLFFINTGQIFGIQDYSIDQNFGQSTLKYFGFGNQSLPQILNGPQYTDLSLNGLLIQEDIISPNTGNFPINCFILKDKNNINTAYSFTSGYLINYTNKYAPNQIIQNNSSFRFYNNCGNIPTGNLDNSLFNQLSGIQNNIYPIFNSNIGNCNYINLILNESTGNRVLNYSFSLNINRLPIYNIGSRYPIKNEIIFPINVECDITFEADENYIDSNTFDFPELQNKQNIEIDVFSHLSNTAIAQYKFQNMTQSTNKRSLSVDGNVIINRKYIGQIFSFINLVSGITPATGWDFGFVYNSPSFYLNWGYITDTVSGTLDFGSVA